MLLTQKNLAFSKLYAKFFVNVLERTPLLLRTTVSDLLTVGPLPVSVFSILYLLSSILTSLAEFTSTTYALNPRFFASSTNLSEVSEDLGLAVRINIVLCSEAPSD